MPSIVLNCPNCRQPYQMSPEQIAKYAGRTITCRKCKQPFSFDAAMDAAAQAAGRSEPVEEESVAAPAGAGEEAEASADDGEGAYAMGAGYSPPVAPPPPPPPPRRPAAVASQAPPPVQPPAGYPPQAYGQPPAASLGFSPAVNQGSAVGGIGDIFGFRRMALPALLPLVFWTGVAFSIYNGVRLLLELVLVTRYDRVVTTISGMRSMPSTSVSFEGLLDRVMSVHGLFTVLDAFFWFVLGPLFWRGFCELIMAASRLLASERK